MPEGESVQEHLAVVGNINGRKLGFIIRVNIFQGESRAIPLDCLTDTGCDIDLIRKGLVGR